MMNAGHIFFLFQMCHTERVVMAVQTFLLYSLLFVHWYIISSRS